MTASRKVGRASRHDRSPARPSRSTGTTSAQATGAIPLVPLLVEIAFVVLDPRLAPQVAGVPGQRLALTLEQEREVCRPIADLRDEALNRGFIPQALLDRTLDGLPNAPA